MEGKHVPVTPPEVPGVAEPTATAPAANSPTATGPAAVSGAGRVWAADVPDDALPVMPGFREMALRRRADEQASRMAEERARLVRALAGQRQAAGLSQTEVAALMGTSQSAVARIESGTADVRASTLERYAAAVGSQISWSLDQTLDQPPEGAGQ